MKLRRGKMRRTSAIDQASLDSWVPRTSIGKDVKEGKITSLVDVMSKGKAMLEPQIVDFLLPNLKTENVELSSTQRMTDSGRKAKYRAAVIVGDETEFVSVGAGKADEVRPAIETAVKNAKLNIVHVNLGCGSAQCNCKYRHSLPVVVSGKYGGVKVTLIPAPRGTGIVANKIIKKVLQLAGISDVWTTASGRTRNRYNTSMAVVNAIDQLNEIRVTQPWETEADQAQRAAAEKEKTEDAAAEPSEASA